MLGNSRQGRDSRAEQMLCSPFCLGSPTPHQGARRLVFATVLPKGLLPCL